MFAGLERLPDSKEHFRIFLNKLQNQDPFSFVRFSDGELEILRNHTLVIEEGAVHWSKGSFRADYPAHDFKEFIPGRDIQLRQDLTDSATYLGENFFKGVPTKSNRASRDRDFLVSLNGGTYSNLTFSDLLINENYKPFLLKALPQIIQRENVFVLANFRANVHALDGSWKHIEVQDNIFGSYLNVIDDLMDFLSGLPASSTVLSSASSLSNIVGHKLHKFRPDVTFIDIGTSINHLIGMGSTSRAYHSQLEPWSLVSFSRKIQYYILGSHKIRW